METPYLHQIALAPAAASVKFSLVTDFSVVAGVSEAAGTLVLPSADREDYLVPGGVLGLPYLSELGSAGRAVQVYFPVAVTALLVATPSGHSPVPQDLESTMSLPEPPKVTGGSFGTVIDYTPQNHGFIYPIYVTWDKPGSPTAFYIKSPGTVPIDQRESAIATLIGKTLAELVAGGFLYSNPYAS